MPERLRTAASTIAATLLAAAATAGDGTTTTVVTFNQGAGGWSGTGGGNSVIESFGGNPGAHLHGIFVDVFGITYFNDSPPWVDDFSQYDSVSVSCDVLVESITFFGQEVSRNWVLEFRDLDDPPGGYPWVSVWTVMGRISAGDVWNTLSVTIDDPSSAELPPGWGGYGAEDPNTFEPILPPGRTFADVLANADRMVLTSFQPGFFYGFTNFDIRLDNLTLVTVAGDPGVPGDVNGDGTVDFSDLLAVLAAWGPCDGCPEDVDGSGAVDFTDLLAVLAAFPG